MSDVAWTIKPWTIETDADGVLHTVCPHCRARDTICERDVGTRWNTLHLIDTISANAALGSSDFDGDGWICSNCLSDDLAAPDNFTVKDWY